MAGGNQWVVRPEDHAFVAGGAGEVEAGVDQAAAEALTAAAWRQQEQAKFGGSLVGAADAEDTANTLAVDLRDPGSFQIRVMLAA